MERQAETVTNCADSQADPSGTYTKVYLLPRREKTCLRGFLTYTIQTRALSYRDNDKLTHTCIRLASFFGSYANSANPDQLPQNAAPAQDLNCLLTGFSNKMNKSEKYHTATLKIGKFHSV